MKITTTTFFLHLFVLAGHLPADDFGTLIFEDKFERSESQEEKDEPGNDWTTSSETTAKGNKEVDLRDGHMYIYTHAEANHATSVRHAFAPCTLAALTTAVGLGSLFTSDILPIQKFGMFSAIGVVATLALLFSLLPACLHRFPPATFGSISVSAAAC